MSVPDRATVTAEGCSTAVATDITLDITSGMNAADSHFNLVIIPEGAGTGSVAVRNIAATTTAKKGFYLDEFAFRLDLPGSRTGFTFT